MDKIKILIADDIEDTRAVIKKILLLSDDAFEVVGEASDGEEVLKKLAILRPDIVLMDINMPKLNGLEATEQITNEYPEIIVIIMSVQAESEYLKKAMFYGAKEYIIKPFDYEALIATLKNTYDKYKEKLIKLNEAEGNSFPAKLISLFSSKGGVGKSVIALNTSIVLSRENTRKTLLIDLDLQFGDLSVYTNQYNQKNILDAIEDNQIDYYDNLKAYMYSHNSNLDILFAPNKPEMAENLTKDIIEKIIKLASKHYDLIIVDTGINFNDVTLHVLDLSQLILYVTTMDIAALKNTKLGLKVMQSLGYDNDKVKVIINRSNADYSVKKSEAEDIFKDGVFEMLPEEEKTVAISVNKGEPFCDSAKYYKLKIGKAIDALCESILEEID